MGFPTSLKNTKNKQTWKQIFEQTPPWGLLRGGSGDFQQKTNHLHITTISPRAHAAATCSAAYIRIENDAWAAPSLNYIWKKLMMEKIYCWESVWKCSYLFYGINKDTFLQLSGLRSVPVCWLLCWLACTGCQRPGPMKWIPLHLHAACVSLSAVPIRPRFLHAGCLGPGLQVTHSKTVGRVQKPSGFFFFCSFVNTPLWWVTCNNDAAVLPAQGPKSLEGSTSVSAWWD